MIRILATLCTLAGPAFGINGPEVKFCVERTIATRQMMGRKDRELAQCNIEAQWQIAAAIKEGESVKDFRCATDDDANFNPRGSI